MAATSRRRFLATLAAGPGAAALASLPPWARAALAAAEPGVIVRNDWPEHWETSLAALGRAWLTPNDVFFVRSHFIPPDVDAATWRLDRRFEPSMDEETRDRKWSGWQDAVRRTLTRR